jgi:hypothetical protein
MMGVTPIRMHTDLGGVDLHRTPPRVLAESSPATLDVRSRKAQVETDFTDYRNAVGALRITELGSQLHEKAVQATIQAIGRIAAEGDQLARIESGSTIAAVAQGEMPTDEVDLSLNMVPPPTFTVTPGGVDVQVTPGELRISWPDAPLRIDVRKATVTVDTEVLPTVNKTA